MVAQNTALNEYSNILNTYSKYCSNILSHHIHSTN